MVTSVDDACKGHRHCRRRRHHHHIIDVPLFFHLQKFGEACHTKGDVRSCQSRRTTLRGS